MTLADRVCIKRRYGRNLECKGRCGGLQGGSARGSDSGRSGVAAGTRLVKKARLGRRWQEHLKLKRWTWGLLKRGRVSSRLHRRRRARQGATQAGLGSADLTSTVQGKLGKAGEVCDGRSSQTAPLHAVAQIRRPRPGSRLPLMECGPRGQTRRLRPCEVSTLCALNTLYLFPLWFRYTSAALEAPAPAVVVTSCVRCVCMSLRFVAASLHLRVASPCAAVCCCHTGWVTAVNTPGVGHPILQRAGPSQPLLRCPASTALLSPVGQMAR